MSSEVRLQLMTITRTLAVLQADSQYSLRAILVTSRFEKAMAPEPALFPVRQTLLNMSAACGI
jgi:hypothetical protein